MVKHQLEDETAMTDKILIISEKLKVSQQLHMLGI